MANVSSSNGIEKHPKLRFPEFSEPWERVRIGDVYAERSERGAVSAELLSVTMTEGVKRRSDIEGKDNSSEDKGNYKVVRIGDMVYNSMRMWQGANGISDYDGIVSPAYTVMKAKRGIANGFFAALFKTHRMIGEFCRHSQGMTSDTWNLKYPQIESIQTYIPTVTEQRKIADMLMYLDRRIEKQHQLLEHLKKYKRGVLRKVFDHISTSCKKSLLGNLCVSISSGKTTHVQDHGQYPLIGSTGPIGYTDIEEFNEELILIARVGANAGAVNYFAGSCGVTDNTLVVRVDKAYSVPEYILYFLEYYDPHRLIFGSGQPLVTGGQLKKIEVPIASKDQQEKVVELFTLLNKYCTCAQQQLDLLICAKKALLQQLFI